MKLIAFLLVWGSLVLGLVSGLTAYQPRVAELPTDPGAELTLSAAAGVDPDDPLGATPLVANGTVLDAATVTRLTEAGVERVKVKEFALGRWDHAWLFLVSVAGLIAGGMLVRQQTKRELQARAAAERHPDESPAAALRAAQQAVAGLRAKQSSTDDGIFLAEVMQVLGEVQREHLEAVVAARDEFIASRGVAGYAQIMDAFAAADRMIARAWSSAADGVRVETEACLEEAESRLDVAALAVGAG